MEIVCKITLNVNVKIIDLGKSEFIKGSCTLLGYDKLKHQDNPLLGKELALLYTSIYIPLISSLMFCTKYDLLNKCVFRALLNSFMSQVALKLEGSRSIIGVRL